MRIKALMVDVDGVILVHPHPAGWSAYLERDLGLSPEALQQHFFQPHFDEVVHGRAALRDRLAPALAEIAPHLSCEALIAYWFEQDYHPDERLLEQLAEVRAAGVEVHLATVQEHERAHYIWRTRGLSHRFNGLHYAAEIGWAKPTPQFFAAIEDRLGLARSELAFIDDKQANVDAAAARGWRAALWTGKRSLREVLPDFRQAIGGEA